MKENNKHDTYVSPFSGRYSSVEMRHLWSESHKRETWRLVWYTLLDQQVRAGFLPADLSGRVEKHLYNLDIDASLAIEKTVKHDLVAELRVFASQSGDAGNYLHLGATSSDIEDNADAVRTKEALSILQQRLRCALSLLVKRIEESKAVPCLAYTHLQEAAPTTVGCRLAVYATSLFADLADLEKLSVNYEGKGLRGAVGTAAAYLLVAGDSLPKHRHLEAGFMARLGLKTPLVTTQISSRRQELAVVQALVRLAATLHKFGLDLRILSSTPFDEAFVGFDSGQIGSSAMPHKRNPISAERLCALTRYLASLERNFFDNAALSLLERTLDDSANRRLALPEVFLAADECLLLVNRLLASFQFDRLRVSGRLRDSGPQLCFELLLTELVHVHGASREIVSARLSGLASSVEPQNLVGVLQDDPLFRQIGLPRLAQLLNPLIGVGAATAYAESVCRAVRSCLTLALDDLSDVPLDD